MTTNPQSTAGNALVDPLDRVMATAMAEFAGARFLIPTRTQAGGWLVQESTTQLQRPDARRNVRHPRCGVELRLSSNGRTVDFVPRPFQALAGDPVVVYPVDEEWANFHSGYRSADFTRGSAHTSAGYAEMLGVLRQCLQTCWDDQWAAKPAISETPVVVQERRCRVAQNQPPGDLGPLAFRRDEYMLYEIRMVRTQMSQLLKDLTQDEEANRFELLQDDWVVLGLYQLLELTTPEGEKSSDDIEEAMRLRIIQILISDRPEVLVASGKLGDPLEAAARYLAAIASHGETPEPQP